MSDQKKDIQKNRILEEFVKLASIDSESFGESEIAGYLKQKLTELGLTVSEDHAGDRLKKSHPSHKNAVSNIYASLKGTLGRETLLFSAHMDTVAPGIDKKPQVQEDGRITSSGDTVLGADDVSGIVSILEALRVIQENKLEHPDIEILFTSAEEPYCEGSRFAEYERLKAKTGYVLDLVGPVGTAAVAAPSILSFHIRIQGKASHAGFASELGVNALTVAAKALADLPVGRTGEGLTVNVGQIRGGTTSNIVPETVELSGEIRSLSHEKGMESAEEIREIFEVKARKAGAFVTMELAERIRAYRVDEDAKVVRRFREAAGRIGRCSMPECITTFGGSDANRLNEHGISTIVIACAMENCHSTEEYTTIEELCRSARLTLELMTMEE